MYTGHNEKEHWVVLGESISNGLQCRAPISNEPTSNPVKPGPLMSPVYSVQHQGTLGESISYVLQYRTPISNELTNNPVNSGPLMWIRGGLGESISYALQCRAPISKELTRYPVNPGPLMSPVYPGALGESFRRVSE